MGQIENEHRFRLKGCAKCGGDLVVDELDWLCLQCGTYYYTNLYQSRTRVEGEIADGPLFSREKSVESGGLPDSADRALFPAQLSVDAPNLTLARTVDMVFAVAQARISSYRNSR